MFEAGGADLMAGQQWFGQLEGRIQRTVEELAAVQEARSGTSPTSCRSRAAARIRARRRASSTRSSPPSSSGRLIVWTEATPTGTARLLQLRPALRGLFEVVRLEPQSPEETDRAGARRGAAPRRGERRARSMPTACAVALSSARQYLSAAQLPGLRARSHQAHASTARSRAAARRSTPHDDHRDPVAAHRPAGLDPRQPGARRSRPRSASYFSRPRHRPGRGRRAPSSTASPCSRPASTIPASRSACSCSPAPTGTGKTELAKTLAEYPVRLGRAHDPPRHERVPDAGVHRTRSSAAASDDRDGLAHQPRAQAAVLRGAARRVREGARQRSGTCSCRCSTTAG